MPARDPGAPPSCPSCGGGCRHRFLVAGHPLFRCSQCRLEFLSPQPDEERLRNLYGAAYYEAWGGADFDRVSRPLKMATFQRRLRELGDRLPRGARLLDVGCATGFFLASARAEGFEAFGVEINPEGAARSREIAGGDRIFQGTLEEAVEQGFPEGGCDGVWMSDLLEHVRDPEATLAAAWACLRDRGLLVITTPWTNSCSRFLAGRRWIHYKEEHLFYFGEKNMTELLARQGFRVLESRPARKVLSLRYARAQRGTMGGALWALGVGISWLPSPFQDGAFPIGIGERTLVASREGR